MKSTISVGGCVQRESTDILFLIKKFFLLYPLSRDILSLIIQKSEDGKKHIQSHLIKVCHGRICFPNADSNVIFFFIDFFFFSFFSCVDCGITEFRIVCNIWNKGMIHGIEIPVAFSLTWN